MRFRLRQSIARLRKIVDMSEPAGIGIIDFVYAPYALGDSLTWQTNVMCNAHDAGLDAVKLFVMVDPSRPKSRLQPHIHPHNFDLYLRNLYPALLSIPSLKSISVFHDRFPFNLQLAVSWLTRRPSWPSYLEHLDYELDYISHRNINRFVDKHGYLPRLGAPKGYWNRVTPYLETAGKGRFVVTVNIRQSRFSTHPADTWRDSPLEPWYELFRRCREKYPEVLFVLLGGFGEWERRIFGHGNVHVFRALGAGLGEELALLHRSDMFIGASSGFAAAATFGETPYVIANMEPRFSKFNEVPVGAPRYPFGLQDQVISWEKETPRLLKELFETVYLRRKDLRPRRSEITAPSPPTPVGGPTASAGQEEV